jgi:hypothetical protein
VRIAVRSHKPHCPGVRRQSLGTGPKVYESSNGPVQGSLFIIMLYTGHVSMYSGSSATELKPGRTPGRFDAGRNARRNSVERRLTAWHAESGQTSRIRMRTRDSRLIHLPAKANTTKRIPLDVMFARKRQQALSPYDKTARFRILCPLETRRCFGEGTLVRGSDHHSVNSALVRLGQ